MSDNNSTFLYTVNTPMDETLLISFSSRSELVERLKLWARSNNFGLIVTRSVHNLVVHLSCKCSGKIKNIIINKSERKKAPRKSIKQGCPFIIKIDTYLNGSCVIRAQDTSKNEHVHNHDLSLGIGMPSAAIVNSIAASATAIPTSILTTAIPSTMPITATAMPNPPIYTEEL